MKPIVILAFIENDAYLTVFRWLIVLSTDMLYYNCLWSQQLMNFWAVLYSNIFICNNIYF